MMCPFFRRPLFPFILLSLDWIPIDNYIYFTVKKFTGLGSSAGSGNNCLFFCSSGNQQSGNIGNTKYQTGTGTHSISRKGKYCLQIFHYPKIRIYKREALKNIIFSSFVLILDIWFGKCSDSAIFFCFEFYSVSFQIMLYILDHIGGVIGSAWHECGRYIDSPSVARGLRYFSTQES